MRRNRNFMKATSMKGKLWSKGQLERVRLSSQSLNIGKGVKEARKRKRGKGQGCRWKQA